MKDMSLKERTEELRKIVYEEFHKYEAENDFVSKKKDLYIEGIEYELGEISACGMADYFLLNYEVVKLAISKYGGVLTQSSRGSASCYFVNKLLGSTSMDRFVYDKLPLFPQRFMSADRILLSKTPPDIDYNTADALPFILASKELLGEENVYPMAAFGLYQVKSSWKLFSRIENISPEIANAVSKNIESYDSAMKYASEEEQEDIHIEDFIADEYVEVFNQSKDVRSIIENIKPHACGVVLSPTNLRKDVGLIAVGKTGNKVMCVADDGSIERRGYMKNDY